MHNVIYITGGGSLLYGMDQMIASELGIPVLLAKEPMDCAALGLGNIIENFDLLQHLAEPASSSRTDATVKANHTILPEEE